MKLVTTGDIIDFYIRIKQIILNIFVINIYLIIEITHYYLSEVELDFMKESLQNKNVFLKLSV